MEGTYEILIPGGLLLTGMGEAGAGVSVSGCGPVAPVRCVVSLRPPEPPQVSRRSLWGVARFLDRPFDART